MSTEDLKNPLSQGDPAESRVAAAAPAPERAPGPAARRRLEELAGMSVRGSDGRPVGRVRDIYLADATGELTAITVMPRQLSPRSVLIPAAAIESLPADPAAPAADGGAAEPGQHVHLRVTAATAHAGSRPPETLHLTVEALHEASAALGLDAGPERGSADAPRSAAEPAQPA